MGLWDLGEGRSVQNPRVWTGAAVSHPLFREPISDDRGGRGGLNRPGAAHEAISAG